MPDETLPDRLLRMRDYTRDEVLKNYESIGVLNGIVGVIQDGPKKDWGFVTAFYDDETGDLLRFERTNENT